MFTTIRRALVLLVTLFAALALAGTLVLAPAAADTPVPNGPATSTPADSTPADSTPSDSTPADTTTTPPPPTSTTPPSTSTPSTTTPSTTTPSTTTPTPSTPSVRVMTRLHVDAIDINTGAFISGVGGNIVSTGMDAPAGETTVVTPATVSIPSGGYALTVTNLPDGYMLAGSGQITDVAFADRDNWVKVHVKVRTMPTGISLYNLDRITGAPLYGAQYIAVVCSSGEKVATFTSNGRQGHGAINVDPGCYYIIQIKAAAGYALDETPYKVAVTLGSYSSLTITNLRLDYVAPRNPADRVPIKSVPSGRTY